MMERKFEPPNPFRDTNDLEYHVGGRLRAYKDPERISWVLFRRDASGAIVEKRIMAESYIKAVIDERAKPPNP